MKNKEMLNICYRFFNEFITSDELVLQLSNLSEDKENVNELIKGIKDIISKIPNEEDEYILSKKNRIKHLIDKFEQMPDSVPFKKDNLDNLNKDYNRKRDCYKRWYEITKYIDSNEYFEKQFESLTDYETLEFIAQNICAPFPPQFNQEEFDKLVKAGIENDEREWLWRLAFNYNRTDIKYDDIIDYFIDKKDGYYLCELISSVGEKLDIDSIINKISDKDLIKYLLDNKNVIKNYVTEEQFNELTNKLV